jgi:hypothetical protein
MARNGGGPPPCGMRRQQRRGGHPVCRLATTRSVAGEALAATQKVLALVLMGVIFLVAAAVNLVLGP